ncbi:MAG: outer membrane protein OmpA-like peptidoglycan-associated protein [Ascidiaceihabitans sp.]|jgi:outer membrane protein OmpA-like peptidoglycan-associated protein
MLTMKRIAYPFAAAALALAPTVTAAATCDEALAGLRSAFGGQSTSALLNAVDAVKSSGCTQATERVAMGQASAILAKFAQAQVAADDLAGAEETLTHAPALHWAVQAIRGDIAAKRGDREEAAQMYSAALDTITDPALTPPDKRLLPVADRIARLAQENIMLSGSLSSTVTRGGQASGVLKSAMRGIQIEKAGAAPKVTPTVDPAYPSTDLYAGAAKETYTVADAVATSVGAVYLPIRFAFGSDQIDAAGAREAETVANFLLSNKVYRLTVVGHTDEVGSDAFNLDLSLRRAKTVKHFLQTKGVHAEIHIDGKGEREPPNLVDYSVYSEEERRKIARRVELLLHE